MAARSSQDLACCWRATKRARSKEASAFAVSACGDLSAISPAMRWTSELAPSFLSCFNFGKRLFEAAPSVIELAKFCVGACQ